MIQSPSIIRFTPSGGSPITLVPAGGWLTEHPRIEGEQPLFEADGIFLSEGVFKPLPGVKVQISFGVEDAPAANHAAAQEAFLSFRSVSLVRLLNVEGSLQFVTADQIATYSPAVITGLTPGLPFDAVSCRTREFRILTVLPNLTTP